MSIGPVTYHTGVLHNLKEVAEKCTVTIYGLLEKSELFGRLARDVRTYCTLVRHNVSCGRMHLAAPPMITTTVSRRIAGSLVSPCAIHAPLQGRVYLADDDPKSIVAAVEDQSRTCIKPPPWRGRITRRSRRSLGPRVPCAMHAGQQKI